MSSVEFCCSQVGAMLSNWRQPLTTKTAPVGPIEFIRFDGRVGGLGSRVGRELESEMVSEWGNVQKGGELS